MNEVAQAPTPSSDTSMTEVSPVVARANSAAAMPPAIVIPPMLSPYAPAGIGERRSAPSGVAPAPLPDRAQKAVMS